MKASNEAVDEDSDDERTLPDSDEAIIALMDDNEEMSKYIVELRAEMAKMREECASQHSTILRLEHQYGVLADRLKQTP